MTFPLSFNSIIKGESTVIVVVREISETLYLRSRMGTKHQRGFGTSQGAKLFSGDHGNWRLPSPFVAEARQISIHINLTSASRQKTAANRADFTHINPYLVYEIYSSR